MKLVTPSLEYLDSYIETVKQGWDPLTLSDTNFNHVKRIEEDPEGFLRLMNTPEQLPAITQPNGQLAPRLHNITRWMWAGEVVGRIQFRYQPNTVELPDYCLGHVSYAVIPQHRGQGYASQAIKLLLPEIQTLNFPYIELVTEKDNTASQRVIATVGGVFVEEFINLAVYGRGEMLRFRIYF